MIENNRQELITDVMNKLIKLNSEYELRIPDSLDSVPIFGEMGLLDSLDLIWFIADVEKLLREKYEINISLVSDKTMSYKNNPFSTIKSLVDFIVKESNV